LAADDWDAIDAAFSGHTDPMLGIDVGAGFAALFSRIVRWLRRRSASARSSDESDSPRHALSGASTRRLPA
jgi:hypothetical protein